MGWYPPDELSYSYLLGLYLGDANLSMTGRTPTLRITLDAIYPGVVDEAGTAVQLTAIAARVTLRKLPSRAVLVGCCWSGWPEALPQHGPGRKHHRRIALEGWQQEIVEREPWWFLRGLLHSDGCRTVNRFRTTLPSGRVAEYEYVRWFFSNFSEDILSLFCVTCDRLGLRWTRSNHRNISVSHRHSTALLDEYVGPKT